MRLKRLHRSHWDIEEIVDDDIWRHTEEVFVWIDGLTADICEKHIMTFNETRRHYSLDRHEYSEYCCGDTSISIYIDVELLSEQREGIQLNTEQTLQMNTTGSTTFKHNNTSQNEQTTLESRFVISFLITSCLMLDFTCLWCPEGKINKSLDNQCKRDEYETHPCGIKPLENITKKPWVWPQQTTANHTTENQNHNIHIHFIRRNRSDLKAYLHQELIHQNLFLHLTHITHVHTHTPKHSLFLHF